MAMNTSEAIVYSGCVQHFLSKSEEITQENIEKWVAHNGSNLSEEQQLQIAKLALVAIENADCNEVVRG